MEDEPFIQWQRGDGGWTIDQWQRGDGGWTKPWQWEMKDGPNHGSGEM